MSDEELLKLLANIESDRTERKAQYSAKVGKEKIFKTICAFANDMPNHKKPGVLFFGARDDGGCENLAISDALLKELTEIRSSGDILPMPVMTVQKHTLNGCEMAVITVFPSEAPPVRYKGDVYVRVGPTTRAATQQEERVLLTNRRAPEFDLQPLSLASIEDLDLDLFTRTYLPSSVSSETLEQNERSLEQKLSSLRLITPLPPFVPTVLGMIVVGKDPVRFLPGAYVQFIRFAGESITDPILDEKMISGSLSDLLKTLDDVISVNLVSATDITSSSVEIRKPDYPLVALQQLMRNAVLHRTYETNSPVRVYWHSDRVEIFSPGGPFRQVTLANFGDLYATDYRNPYLAEAMRNLGYVQKFGFGIQAARKELQRNGNPSLEFDLDASHVIAIIRRSK